MNKRGVLIGCFICLGIFGFAQATHAASLKRLFLNYEALAERGYTVEKRGIRIGIRPGIFHESAWVALKSSDLDAPENWKFLKGPMVYDIRVDNPEVLDDPIWLSFNMNGYTSDKKIQAAFYNRIEDRWQFIPTSRIPSGEYRSAIHFPYSTIALFESTTENVIPEQILDDPILIDTAAAAVMDRDSGAVIYTKNGTEQRSIASITKLMTALVVLDTHPDWDRVITWDNAWDREGARLSITSGEQLTVRNLWYTMLTASANNAAIALAASTGMSLTDFVQAMNAKADELHLEHTRFVEPTGLDSQNTSTAEEMLIFSSEAFRHMEVLQATTSKSYTFQTSAGNWHYLKNTNDLLYSPLYITGSKTGYTEEAGYCLTMQTVGPKDQSLVAIVLGTSTKFSRNEQEERLINWAYSAFAW